MESLLIAITLLTTNGAEPGKAPPMEATPPLEIDEILAASCTPGLKCAIPSYRTLDFRPV